MATIVTNPNWVQIDGTRIQKGSRDIIPLSNGVRLKSWGNGEHWDIPVLGTTIDGATVSGKDELIEFFESQGFRSGGGAPAEGGVESVTGDLVDNTDPKNPTVNLPTLNEGYFLVGGADGNVGRRITETDFTELPVGDAYFALRRHPINGWSWIATRGSAVNNTLTLRTSGGQGKFAPAINDDEAVVKSQMDAVQAAINLLLQAKADVVDGKIPENFLPSYIDNVQEFDESADFPAEGLDNIIYIDKSDNTAHRWSGTGYVQITSGLVLGETSSTAYRGDRGKEAYDHSQETSGNPHNVTKSDVGLGNVDNTSDLDKPIPNAVQTALNGKQDELTAGSNIVIEGNTISAASGGRELPISEIVHSGGFTISEYSDRIEYWAKIQTPSITIGTGGNRYQSYDTGYTLPEGITIKGADWCEINVRNPQRTAHITVYDSTSRAIALGLFNNFHNSSSTSVDPTIFIKLIYNKGA